MADVDRNIQAIVAYYGDKVRLGPIEVKQLTDKVEYAKAAASLDMAIAACHDWPVREVLQHTADHFDAYLQAMADYPPQIWLKEPICPECGNELDGPFGFTWTIVWGVGTCLKCRLLTFRFYHRVLEGTHVLQAPSLEIVDREIMRKALQALTEQEVSGVHTASGVSAVGG